MIETALAGGPSPPLRGYLGPRASRLPAWGPIPAPAGSLHCPASTPFSHPAHPRPCGVTSSLAGIGLLLIGPSPRLRGFPRNTWPPLRWPRSISAPAGLLLLVAASEYRMRVHPRARGVTRPYTGIASAPAGSSPRPRGYLWFWKIIAPLSGPIPAPAGSPDASLALSRANSAHPRSRGLIPLHRLLVGIPPAHPRASGVIWAMKPRPSWSVGPSPPPRGHPALHLCLALRRRPIPAPAGASLSS